jgi:hypothetical protein
MSKIIIYSIKKSGTHMISGIISLLIDINTNIYNKNDMYKVVPHITSNKSFNKFNQCYMSTHPKYFDMKNPIINNKDNRIIFIIRNPLDLCISQYFFYEKRKQKNTQLTLFDYCKKNYKEQLRLVNRHIKKQKKVENSILISFEETIFNKKLLIEKIYYFLKINNKLENIDLNEDLIQKIISKTEFSKLKTNEIKNGNYMVSKKQPSLFHRKGTFNQWKEYFTEDEYNNIINTNNKSTDSTIIKSTDSTIIKSTDSTIIKRRHSI